MIAFLTGDRAVFYMRGDRVYIDTTVLKGKKMLLLEGAEFRSFILKLAKVTDSVLLRGADADLIVDHVLYHAIENAIPLAKDARAEFTEEGLLINTGWEGSKVIRVLPAGGWEETTVVDRIFEPMSPKMRMTVPVMSEAKAFPEILKAGIADFGDHHCLLCVTCATLMLPADFPHPFIVFTGDQARGKSTTMKLLTQLVDPYEGAELMTVGEDIRDLIALVRGRHSIALDNVSKLPFDEDLLSKMYSGGLFAARKMATNSEISEVEMPRLRVLLNGIGAAFSRSDLMSRCIFIEHPVLTGGGMGREERFKSLSDVEDAWKEKLPMAFGSLLSVIGEGMKLYNERGGTKGKTAGSRFVEYCIIGECMAEVMGFDAGLFTKQVKAANEMQKEGAIAADDCAQLILAWLNGERGGTTQLDWTAKEPAIEDKVVSTSDLFSEVRSIATNRGYSIYSMKWLSTVKSFSTALTRSRKNVENGGWYGEQIVGGPNNRNWKFTKLT